ncbi:MAG: lasso peptide biosynthesis B2 protein [Telluria sp.]|nr:lasso peptide biosynthesis B2 protein [Telluria sp.]
MREVKDAVARFRALGGEEKRSVMLAVVLLPYCWLALRSLGLARVLARLRRLPTGVQLTPDAIQSARLLGRAVNIAARRGPFRMSCLTRSVLLAWLLRRRGIDVGVRIGVKVSAGEMAAHAWVQCAGVPVNDRPDIAAEFAPFDEVAPLAVFRS